MMGLPARMPTLVVSIFVLALCFGCTAGPSVERAAGVDVVLAGRTSGGMDARLDGKITVVGETCLGVMEGSQGVVIAWPPGTDVSVIAGAVTVEMDGRRFGLGDMISGSGGALQSNSEDLPKLPESCAGLEVFALQSVNVG